MADKPEDERLSELVRQYQQLGNDLANFSKDADCRIAALEAYFDSLPAWVRRLSGWSKAKKGR